MATEFWQKWNKTNEFEFLLVINSQYSHLAKHNIFRLNNKANAEGIGTSLASLALLEEGCKYVKEKSSTKSIAINWWEIFHYCTVPYVFHYGENALSNFKLPILCLHALLLHGCRNPSSLVFSSPFPYRIRVRCQSS